MIDVAPVRLHGSIGASAAHRTCRASVARYPAHDPGIMKIRAGRRAAYVHSMSQGEKGPLTLRETPVGVRTQHQKLSALRTSLSG